MAEEFLLIVLALVGISGFVWLYLKLMLFLDEWWTRKFGWSVRRERTSKIEIQTLFHGNTKDQDQI